MASFNDVRRLVAALRKLADDYDDERPLEPLDPRDEPVWLALLSASTFYHPSRELPMRAGEAASILLMEGVPLPPAEAEAALDRIARTGRIERLPGAIRIRADRVTAAPRMRRPSSAANRDRLLETARAVAELVGPLCDAFAVGEIDPEHTVNVLQPDGSSRVECSHTFPGTTRCAHCGVPAIVLRARDRAGALSLQLDELAGAFES